MIACRAEALRIAARTIPIALTLACAIAAPAMAQLGPPVRLVPRPDAIEPPPPEPARPATPDLGLPTDPALPGATRPLAPDSPRVDQAPIEIGEPSPLNADAVGVIGDAQGALPVDLWRGSNRAMVERLVGEITAPIVSPAVRSLALRVLASGGEPPAAGGASLPDARSFVAQRAEKLLALGDVADAAGLAHQAPSRAEDSALGLVQLDAAWIAYDEAEACGQAFAQIAHFDDAYRQKSLIYCQAAKNDKERAQLGLRMLREQQQQGEDDPSFARLLAILLGESRGPIDSLKQATPLHLVMARAARQQLPADTAQGAPTNVLAMIATSANVGNDTRVAAAERAEAAGAIPTAALAQIYDGLTVRPDDLARALDIAGRERTARARWLPYRAAKAAPANASRLAILARYWQMVRERNGYAAAARLTVPLLQDIAPSAELAGYAGEAVRALLLTHQNDGAKQWLDAAASGPALDATVADTAVLAWPLLRIAGGAADVSDAEASTRLDAWRRAQQRINPAGVTGRVTTLAILLSALGDGGGGELLTQAATLGAPDRQPPAGPNLGVMIGLTEAAAAKRIGETALLSVVALGGDGPASVSMLSLAKVIEALRAVGLTADARAIALEAAILSGL